jgi:hypothetical protein
MVVQTVVRSQQDCINIALFSPVPGAGVLYCTKQGKLVLVRAKHDGWGRNTVVDREL